jgi:hypothetical protein
VYHQRAEHRQHQRGGAEQHHLQRGRLHAAFDPAVDFSRSVRIKTPEHVEIVGQRRPHRPVGVVVAPFAAGRRTDLGAAAHQLAAELLEFLHPRGKLSEYVRIVRPHRPFPTLHHAADLLVETGEAFGKLLRGGDVRRHVNAARFHDHGVDQAVDALDILGTHKGRFELVGQGDVPVATENRHRRQRPRHGSQQRKDDIELAGNRKFRQFHASPQTVRFRHVFLAIRC